VVVLLLQLLDVPPSPLSTYHVAFLMSQVHSSWPSGLRSWQLWYNGFLRTTYARLVRTSRHSEELTTCVSINTFVSTDISLVHQAPLLLPVFFPILCYGSVVYASVCLSVCHKLVFYWTNWQDQTHFGIQYSLSLSYIVWRGTRLSPKIRVFPSDILFQTPDFENPAMVHRLLQVLST